MVDVDWAAWWAFGEEKINIVCVMYTHTHTPVPHTHITSTRITCVLVCVHGYL